jgi:hypothetical protein
MKEKSSKGDERNQRKEETRNLMMQGTLMAQTIERCGLEGMTGLLVLALSCLSGFFFVFLAWKLLKLLRVGLWLIRIMIATRQASSSRPAARQRGRSWLQSCAVRLRDRPIGILCCGRRMAGLALARAGDAAWTAIKARDLSEAEGRTWLSTFSNTVRVALPDWGTRESPTTGRGNAPSRRPVAKKSVQPTTAPPWEADPLFAAEDDAVPDDLSGILAEDAAGE